MVKLKAKTKAKAAAKPASKAKAKAGAKPAQKRAKPSAPMNPLSPHIVCRGAADAIAFYKKAFGAEEMMRLAGGDGKLMHAAVRINGATVMMVDENVAWGCLSPKSLNGSPVTLHLMVDNVDAFVARAVKAGATLKMPVADMFWGDRYGIVVDPFGHNWSIATHMRDMTLDEIKSAMRRAMPSG